MGRAILTGHHAGQWIARPPLAMRPPSAGSASSRYRTVATHAPGASAHEKASPVQPVYRVSHRVTMRHFMGTARAEGWPTRRSLQPLHPRPRHTDRHRRNVRSVTPHLSAVSTISALAVVGADRLFKLHLPHVMVALLARATLNRTDDVLSTISKIFHL
jgi:hypothetical protein